MSKSYNPLVRAGFDNGENPDTTKYIADLKAISVGEVPIRTTDGFAGATASGTGDMTRVVYDANENGIVDDSEKLGGQLPTYYAKQSDISNIDNTSDLSKPISNATTSALALKVDKITGKGLSTNDLTNELLLSLGEYVAMQDVCKEHTGFDDPSAVTVSYDKTTRKVTLTGTFKAYWRDTEVTALTNGWVSPAHDEGKTVNQYLYYNGTNFLWADSLFPSFDMLQIASTWYDSTVGITSHIGMREPHGLNMPYDCHQDLHFNVGTYRRSGGTSSGVTLASTTAANRRPAISECVIYDEDLKSTLPQLVAGTYTQHYLSGASTAPSSNIVLNAGDIIPLSTNRPYWNKLTGGSWQQTLMNTGDYTSVWVVALPATADANSQPYRYIFVQGQSINPSANAGQRASALAAQLAIDPSTLNLYSLSSFSAEWVIIQQYVIYYNGTNWTIEGQQAISGTRAKPVAVSGVTTQTAANIITDTINFGQAIPTTATNVQLALDALDDIGEYGIFTLSADQTSNLATNSHWEFNTKTGGTNLTLSTGAGQANGRVTFPANTKWLLLGAGRAVVGSGQSSITFYNVTTSSIVGSYCVITRDFASFATPQSLMTHILETGANPQTIEVRDANNTNGITTLFNGGTFWIAVRIGA